jgi:hypothetical protein
MSDLDNKEQQHVRAALRLLRNHLGTWAIVGSGLNITGKSLEKVARCEKTVSASLAFRVARLLNVLVDDLLVGKFLQPGACPNCGHIITSEFRDEHTVVDEIPHRTTDKSQLVQ